MSSISRLQQWWRQRARDEQSRWTADTPPWLASFVVHAAILSTMIAIGAVVPRHQELITLLTPENTPEDVLTTSPEFSYSETPQEAIGTALAGEAGTLDAGAPALAMTTTLPTQIEPADPQALVSQRVAMQEEIRLATSTRFAENLIIKGAAGVGATGTTGAIDRITQEILLSLEERKTLVVWLFDQSGSLARQRSEIIQRFEKIYEELGVIEASNNPAFKKHDDKPLLTAVVGFGQNITFLTAKPTDDIKEIKSAVSNLKTDASGLERTFGAVYEAVERYRSLRNGESRRNVMLVAFTDEVGDDEKELDRTVAICRRYEIPVYVIGVPAPFGRRDALIKYVDPDPKYDQTPQWVPVRQGPESFLPELVQIGALESEEPMDSGFGPYSLTRLCVETNGIFLAVHPNRDERKTISRRDTAELSAQLSHFFDPEVMRGYRPDYVSLKEYQKLVAENRARTALVKAATMSAEMKWEAAARHPEMNFPKISDADLANRFTQAQHPFAVLEPKINELYEVLRQGEKDRPRLTKARWQAGYDLSMGRLLALKVRAEGYQAMLAKAKGGMRFSDPKHDTWRLVPAEEVSISSTLEKQAETAKTYLARVVSDHPDTPWALLAHEELKRPLGWAWQETYTGVNVPKPQVAANVNKGRRNPQDDKA
ncbi:MAG TPA: vWA domain-containing protein, partial [Pirellulales bacterium]|nr:vWA domain-containing protein [Pirellulales bacterium]